MIKPPWYENIISNNIILPNNTFTKSLFHKVDVNIKSSIYQTTSKPNITMFPNNISDNKDKIKATAKKLIKKLTSNIKRENDRTDKIVNNMINNIVTKQNTDIESIYNKLETDIKENHKLYDNYIKKVKEDIQYEMDNYDTVTRVEKHNLLLTVTQKNIIKKWINECKSLYNTCVNEHNTDNKYFNKGYKK